MRIIPNSGSGEPRERLRIGIFGAFHPQTGNAATSSTGIAYLLAKSERVSEVAAFVPCSSQLPSTCRDGKINLVRCWTFDDPVSLLKALLVMRKSRHELSGFIFNIYLTSFGVRRISNVLGLIMPAVLRLTSNRPVVVYLQNFLASQDVSRLGYNPSRATRAGVMAIERMLSKSTKLVLPLERQTKAFRDDIKGSCSALLIPFVDAVFLPEPYDTKLQGLSYYPSEKGGKVDILLFGAWGPQKDLLGVLRALQSFNVEGRTTRVTVAGHANQNHPSYATIMETVRTFGGSGAVNVIESPTSEELPAIFQSTDVLILPYLSLEGFSGVMNLGAYYGLRIIAYDIPELRACAEALDYPVEFVPVGDYRALLQALSAPNSLHPDLVSRKSSPVEHTRVASLAAGKLLDLIQPKEGM